MPQAPRPGWPYVSTAYDNDTLFTLECQDTKGPTIANRGWRPNVGQLRAVALQYLHCGGGAGRGPEAGGGTKTV